MANHGGAQHANFDVDYVIIYRFTDTRKPFEFKTMLILTAF